MKLEEIHAKDIVEFKTRLLNKPVEDNGVVKEVSKDECWDEWYVEVIPFNLKVSYLLLKPTRVKRKIGEYSNFDFTNDESSHFFKLGYKFKLKLTDEFYRRYINEIGYAYWNTAEEMKEAFNGADEVEFMIDGYEGPHLNHASSNVKCFRITDRFIREFSI